MAWKEGWDVINLQVPTELNAALKIRAAQEYVQRSDIVRTAVLTLLGYKSLKEFMDADHDYKDAKKNMSINDNEVAA